MFSKKENQQINTKEQLVKQDLNRVVFVDLFINLNVEVNLESKNLKKSNLGKLFSKAFFLLTLLSMDYSMVLKNINFVINIIIRIF